MDPLVSCTLYFDKDKTYFLSAGGVWLEPDNILRPGCVLIKEGRVKEVGPGIQSPGSEVEFLDFSHLFLIPGLIDAHVHLALGQGMGLITKVEHVVNAGMAAVRDGGDRDGLVLKRRNQIENRIVLAAAGQALFRAGRYGAFLGRPLTGKKEMVESVESLVKAGVDQIKVLVSGPVGLNRYNQVGPPQFETQELADLVSCARDHGLEVMAHANGPEAVTRAVRAGVNSIEHGYFMGLDALDLIAENGVYWVPTIEPLAVLAESETEPPKRRALIKRVINNQIKQLTRARDLGIHLGLGTDAGSPGVEVDSGLRREMAWWRKAGFSGSEILSIATADNAKLIGREEDVGRLTPGHLAFIIGLPDHVSLDQAPFVRPEMIGFPQL
ncbi:MAG: amidohydrolase family protein [Deltaproteobacteria bacterium]|nr:amidohydrolase family protein [Deltaproteobacteria bacterium]